MRSCHLQVTALHVIKCCPAYYKIIPALDTILSLTSDSIVCNAGIILYIILCFQLPAPFLSLHINLSLRTWKFLLFTFMFIQYDCITAYIIICLMKVIKVCII